MGINDTILLKIKESGLKKKFIADKLNIKPSLFSLQLSNERSIPDEKVKELLELLEKVS